MLTSSYKVPDEVRYTLDDVRLYWQDCLVGYDNSKVGKIVDFCMADGEVELTVRDSKNMYDRVTFNSENLIKKPVNYGNFACVGRVYRIVHPPNRVFRKGLCLDYVSAFSIDPLSGSTRRYGGTVPPLVIKQMLFGRRKSKLWKAKLICLGDDIILNMVGEVYNILLDSTFIGEVTKSDGVKLNPTFSHMRCCIEAQLGG